MLNWDCFSGSAPGNLRLGYDPGRAPARPNALFSYKFKIQNPDTATATGVVFTDTISSGIVSATLPGGSCDINDQLVTCRLATLRPHATANVTMVVNAPAVGGSIDNLAAITFDQLQKWDVQEFFSTDVKAGK